MTIETPDFLSDLSALRRLIPEPPQRVVAKIVRDVDEDAGSWIAASALVGVAVRSATGLAVGALVGDGSEAPAARIDDRCLQLAAAGWIGVDPAACRAGDRVGLLFLRAGEGTCLRVNGSIVAEAAMDTEPPLTIAVEEVFVHCPKAVVRSNLWQSRPNSLSDLEKDEGSTLGPASLAFLDGAPFALRATASDAGADLSPRGDPPGFVHALDERTLLMPDRPGNRIADSFRNVLVDPRIGLLFLVPGSARALALHGRARLTEDPSLLAPLAVRDRPPKLATWIELESVRLLTIEDRARSLWEVAERTSALPTAGELLVRQIEPKGRFQKAKGKMVDWMLARDARKNLY
ncbi:MAG: pyridoxamine 5'-phosphate oxidase family protein [Acidobacteriota bacterium]